MYAGGKGLLRQRDNLGCVSRLEIPPQNLVIITIGGEGRERGEGGEGRGGEGRERRERGEGREGRGRGEGRESFCLRTCRHPD